MNEQEGNVNFVFLNENENVINEEEKLATPRREFFVFSQGVDKSCLTPERYGPFAKYLHDWIARKFVEEHQKFKELIKENKKRKKPKEPDGDELNLLFEGMNISSKGYIYSIAPRLLIKGKRSESAYHVLRENETIGCKSYAYHVVLGFYVYPQSIVNHGMEAIKKDFLQKVQIYYRQKDGDWVLIEPYLRKKMAKEKVNETFKGIDFGTYPVPTELRGDENSIYENFYWCRYVIKIPLQSVSKNKDHNVALSLGYPNENETNILFQRVVDITDRMVSKKEKGKVHFQILRNSVVGTEIHNLPIRDRILLLKNGDVVGINLKKIRVSNKTIKYPTTILEKYEISASLCFYLMRMMNQHKFILSSSFRSYVNFNDEKREIEIHLGCANQVFLANIIKKIVNQNSNWVIIKQIREPRIALPRNEHRGNGITVNIDLEGMNEKKLQRICRKHKLKTGGRNKEDVVLEYKDMIHRDKFEEF